MIQRRTVRSDTPHRAAAARADRTADMLASLRRAAWPARAPAGAGVGRRRPRSGDVPSGTGSAADLEADDGADAPLDTESLASDVDDGGADAPLEGWAEPSAEVGLADSDLRGVQD